MEIKKEPQPLSSSDEARMIYFLMDYMNLVSCDFCKDGCVHCNDKSFQKAFDY